MTILTISRYVIVWPSMNREVSIFGNSQYLREGSTKIKDEHNSILLFLETNV